MTLKDIDPTYYEQIQTFYRRKEIQMNDIEQPEPESTQKLTLTPMPSLFDQINPASYRYFAELALLQQAAVEIKSELEQITMAIIDLKIEVDAIREELKVVRRKTDKIAATLEQPKKGTKSKWSALKK